MKPNIKLYFRTIYYSFFKSERTPGRITPKRFFVLIFIFLLYPIWYFSIRLAYGLDQLFYPQHIQQKIEQPVFIVGNFRSGTTLLHRLLAKDPQFTAMKAWEIYIAPSIVQRKLIHRLMKANRLIGNPIQKFINRFDKSLKDYSYMHRTGLNEVEEDSHLFFHIWSAYDLIAFFPFPELIRNYIYYDENVDEEQKKWDFAYYEEALKRHVYANNGKRYVSKSPSFSPKVKTLHRQFPDAKFINIVRSPLRVLPSSVSMFSNHWKTYGDPTEPYPKPGIEVMQEQTKHWYLYPHQYLKNLPSEQYCVLRYQDLVKNPKRAIERIYQRFDLKLSEEFGEILTRESKKSKNFKSNHSYSLDEMGLNSEDIQREYLEVIETYRLGVKKSVT